MECAQLAAALRCDQLAGGVGHGFYDLLVRICLGRSLMSDPRASSLTYKSGSKLQHSR